jgi:hypothetical protein
MREPMYSLQNVILVMLGFDNLTVLDIRTHLHHTSVFDIDTALGCLVKNKYIELADNDCYRTL